MRPIQSLSLRAVLHWLLIAAGPFGPCSGAAADGARLPQDHEYQKVLRDYIATLSEADMAIELAPVTFDPNWVKSADEYYRLWALFCQGHSLEVGCEVGGLLEPASHYTLEAIEGGEKIMAPFSGRSDQNISNAWWGDWDYPGNPYFGKAARNRAFVAASVNMMMYDRRLDQPDSRGYRRSDFIGGILYQSAYPYSIVKQDLPEKVQQAYEAGLRRLVDWMVKLGPDRRNDNMNMKGLLGLWYTAQSFADPKLAKKCESCAKRIVETVVHPCGMIYDAGGLEASYNGIALHFTVGAALASDWRFLDETVARMSRLKGDLTLPEPDGMHYVGPSHFNSRTPGSVTEDQWARNFRDLAAAMVCDEAIYLMFGGRDNRHTGRGAAAYVPADTGQMQSEIEQKLRYFNKQFNPDTDPVRAQRQRYEPLQPWRGGHWPSVRNYVYEDYVPGFYARLKELQREDSPLIKVPLLRDQRFVRNYSDTFLVARFPRYAAIIYTGRIGWHGYMNFAGGAISAFWTPPGGSMILGRSAGANKPALQNWEGWRTWPTHALSGSTGAKAFSSARIRRRVMDIDYQVDEDNVRITVSGPIGAQHDGGRATQDKCIQGELRYARTFSLDADGMRVETSMTSDKQDTVTEVCEMIPLFMRTTYQRVPGEEFTPNKNQSQMPAAPSVEFRVGSEWQPADEDLTAKVKAVKLERFNGAMVIEFDRPRRVKLSPVWTHGPIRVRNVAVDLLEKPDGTERVPLPANASVRYIVRAESLERKTP